MRAVDCPSPNFDDRPAGKPVDMLLLHYTGMENAEAALRNLCDPAAKVSAHYTVDEDGTVYRHVPEDKRAWHAGLAWWAGESDINGISIGVEIVNPGHEFGYRPFPDAQMQSVVALCAEIVSRHAIAAHRVLGHSDVAPARKQDPGELFDWARLAEAGVGLWPSAVPAAEVSLADFQRDLGDFGYDCDPSGVLDSRTASVITAFQRHFRPAKLDGRPDTECAGIAAALAKATRGSEG